MQNITVVYEHKQFGAQCFHVRHANTETLQQLFDNTDIYMLDHIIEQTKTIGVNDFKIYSSQTDLQAFIYKWNLHY